MNSRRTGPSAARSFFLIAYACALGIGGAGPGAPGAALSPPEVRIFRLEVAPSGKTGFTRLSPEDTGLLFTNELANTRSLTNHILLNGSGLALGDVNGDGRVDLYTCSLDGPNALFLNQGDNRFHRDTSSAALACPDLDATGAALADLDGDGDLDLLVNALGRGTLCYLNDGHGRFQDATRAAGTGSLAGAMSLALADVDGDGDLDVYSTHYRTSTVRDRFNVRLRMNRVNGRLVVTAYEGRPTTEPDLVGRFSVDDAGNLIENGEADTLFLNDGHAVFRPLPFTGGSFLDEDGQPLREPPFDWSLSAMFRDLDRDGWPDLYVCSDMASSDRVWMNLRDGRFRAIRREALRKSSWFSMGVDFGDLNRDDLDDFLVTDMVSREHRLRQVQISNHKLVFARPGVIDDRPQAPRNTLFLNEGDGDFAEIAYVAGLEASEWSWAPVFLDVDLDGFEDVLVVTGFERDVQDIDVANELEAARQNRRLSDTDALALRARFPSLHQANLLFRNQGDLTFAETGAAWGFSEVGISQGLALADLDGDGDLDVVVNNLNAPLGVYRNDTPAPRVAVRLRGLSPNTQGIGARIRLFGGATPIQSQEMISGGRYLSCDDAVRVFAAGSLSNRMRLEVSWRSGRRSVLTEVRANCLYEIAEPTSPPPPPALDTPPSPLFADATEKLDHRHRESDFDDWARQPLLPRKLSQAGPALAWHDLDGDQWPDLIIGTGRGGALALLRNDTHGSFTAFTTNFTRPLARDLSGVLVLDEGDSPEILAGFSNYEGAPGEPGAVMRLDLASGTASDAVPLQAEEPGPLALADIDGDGDLDLMVGGRLLPGRYPEAARSRVFRRQDGLWQLDEDNVAPLAGVGLVNGAVFTDLDGDGRPELVLACEWGPLRVFRNSGHGRLREVTTELGFGAWLGWWQGVTADDLDGDGRMDLIAANWGHNTRCRPTSDHPLELLFGDFNGGGQVDLLEAYFDPALGKVVPRHHFGRVRAALPFVQKHFHNYHEFSTASVEEVLGDRLATARRLTAPWLASTAFLNRGDHFEAQPLPFEAQLSPAFAVCAADFDGDGSEDLFLSQNFFATDPENDRHDGGRGLLLLGDGRGGFRPQSARQSGIRVYGEQRAAALADFDRDGRTDLAVSQNGNQTRLFRNARGHAGLRVRLRGSDGNPHGIGAVLRAEFETGALGPARELHAGSGYLSQDDSVTVLAAPRPIRAVQVKWPGGRNARAEVPPGAQQVEIDIRKVSP